MLGDVVLVELKGARELPCLPLLFILVVENDLPVRGAVLFNCSEVDYIVELLGDPMSCIGFRLWCGMGIWRSGGFVGVSKRERDGKRT
jgi:hypothetical protein